MFFETTTGSSNSLTIKLEYTPPKYYIESCVTSWPKMSEVSSENVRIWKITKTSKKFTIECNDVVVVDVLYSSSVECESDWKNKDIASFKFGTGDTATDYYIPMLTCMCIL